MIIFFGVVNTFAADLPIRGRVFLGSSNGSLSNVNNELKNLGLEELSSIPFFGAELTYSVLPFVEVGLNYLKRQNIRKSTSNPSLDYGTEFDQNVFLGILRIPFVKTSLLRIDVFAGFGGSNTTLNIKSATQNGVL